MKKVNIAAMAVLAASSIFLASTEASAWCWKRENGRQACSIGFTEECCQGALEKWVSDEATVVSEYRISTSTSPGRFADIVAGFGKWNEIEMSTFSFEKGADTPIWYAGRDSVNVVNLDATFCTHYPELCGVGILGFSATYTRGTEETYKAVEADIILNGEEFTWGPEGSTDDVIDTVAVVAHESGHNAGLSHAGGDCRGAGSAGCGPEVEAATMYWNYSAGQPTNKASLELDDVAALVAGYPRSTFRVQVVDTATLSPVEDATVTVNSTAFPVSIGDGALDPLDYGVSRNGGYILGDTASADTLVGDRAASATYLASAAHFRLTDVNGYTEYRTPITRSFHVKAQKGIASADQFVEVADGQQTVTISIDLARTEDFGAPTLNIESHTDGQLVNTSSITLRGTATDDGTGDSGISAVYVNGLRALGDVATGAGTAEWAANMTLDEGPNRIEVVALDNSSTPEWNVMTKTIMVISDTTQPEAIETNPSVGLVDTVPTPIIGITFSEALDPATVTGANVTLTHTGGDVLGTVSYLSDSHVVQFTPTVALDFEKTYTLTVGVGVTDLAGNALEEPFSFNVSTRGRSGTEDPGSNGGNHGAGAPDAGKQGGCFIDTLLNFAR